MWKLHEGEIQSMDLFDQLNTTPLNLLPYDGQALYFGKIMEWRDADLYFDSLLNDVCWQNDKAIIFGKQILTDRKVAWYADQPYTYTYSKTTKTAKPWLPVLIELRDIVQKESGETYNSCLLNLYHTGAEGMAWHSDAERDLKRNGAIASLSLGAERKFSFKHKSSQQTLSKVLEHGSLLVMKGETQTHWLHRLPPTRVIHTPRINLTFRTIDNQDTPS